MQESPPPPYSSKSGIESKCSVPPYNPSQQAKRRSSSAWALHSGIAALIVVVFAVVLYRTTQDPKIWQQVMPETVYELNYSLVMDGAGGDIHTSVFLPENSKNQRIDRLDVVTGAMAYTQERTSSGLQGIWEAITPVGLRKMGYRVRFSTHAVQFEIDPELRFETEVLSTEMAEHLISTSTIEVDDPGVKAILDRDELSSAQTVTEFLNVLFDSLQNELSHRENIASGKSSTALALGEGTTLDHANVFAAIARAKGLPTRVISGFLLNSDTPIRHFWNEVYVGGHWVPICLKYDYIAELPSHFLRLSDVSNGIKPNILAGTVVARTLTAQPFLSPPHESDQAAMEPGRSFNLVNFLHGMGLDRKTSGLFLMFPLAALVTAFFRNVIGLQTFGVFMPMLIAAACCYTGLTEGLLVFSIVLVLATLFHFLFETMRIHRIAKMSAVITVITIFMLGMLAWKDLSLYADVNVLAVFPVVILSFTAHHLSDLVQERDWSTLTKNSLSTIGLIVLCFLAFDSSLLRGLFGTFPELLLLVFALQIWVGCWVALRLSEYFRFWDLIRSKRNDINFDAEMSILGINKRNRELVHTLNRKDTIRLANDKIASKSAFETHQVPAPRTLFTVTEFRQAEEVEDLCRGIESMVIKPANGSQGKGVTLLVRREGDTFFEPSGVPLSLDDISNNMREITRGTFSKDGESDSVLVETLITPSDMFDDLVLKGVPDIRVILLNQKAIAAMLRLPTKESKGKSNLHQGAIGVDIDLQTGICGKARYKGKQVDKHPDSGARVTGFQIPGWSRVLTVAIQAQQAVPLAYAGVDICIDQERGPVVIEINARPGIEIQNIRQQGLQSVLEEELQPTLS